MKTIKKLCEGQNRAVRRRIMAAYWLGAADAIKSGAKQPKNLPMLLRHQAD